LGHAASRSATASRIDDLRRIDAPSDDGFDRFVFV
jgi:hypothetical protein